MQAHNINVNTKTCLKLLRIILNRLQLKSADVSVCDKTETSEIFVLSRY